MVCAGAENMPEDRPILASSPSPHGHWGFPKVYEVMLKDVFRIYFVSFAKNPLKISANVV